LLVNFLDLIDILISAPENAKRTEKIDDLTLLFVHIHHLLNEYRPHQARETLRVMMELQKRQRIETAKRFNYHLEKVRDIVNNGFTNLIPFNCDETHEMMEIDKLNSSLDSQLNDSVDPNDRLMCSIVDQMEYS
jgi:mediator of RNA polymerase II transcription subunit 7